jgi:UDP-N-acetylglucosamine 2-epimerase
VACRPHIFDQVRGLNANAVFTAGAWPRVISQARREGARRARHLAAFGDWNLPEFPSPSAPLVEAAVRREILRQLPVVAEAVANARTAFARFRPKLLVVGNDITLEGRAGCRVAARHEVPTATFMHGSITGDILQTMHCVDRLLVHGEKNRQELMQQGVDPKRIEVCGAPNLDDRPSQTGRIHELLQARLGIRNGDPWILVATSGPGHRISNRHHQLVIDHLRRLSAALPGVSVVVKLHRKDRIAYYREAIQGPDDSRLLVVADGTPGFPRDILHWLQGCPVVLTGASTVGVEAMLMDVPVITMDFCDEIHDVDFIEAGATVHVRTAESLENAVREILAARRPREDVESRVQAYLNAAFFALEGCTSSRGAKALRAMIRA